MTGKDRGGRDRSRVRNTQKPSDYVDQRIDRAPLLTRRIPEDCLLLLSVVVQPRTSKPYEYSFKPVFEAGKLYKRR